MQTWGGGGLRQGVASFTETRVLRGGHETWMVVTTRPSALAPRAGHACVQYRLMLCGAGGTPMGFTPPSGLQGACP